MINNKVAVCESLNNKTAICDNKLTHCPLYVVGNRELTTSGDKELTTHLNVTNSMYNELSKTVYGLGEHCDGAMCHYPGYDGLYVNFL